MRNINEHNNWLEEATTYLKEKLSLHTDSISIDKLQYLFSIDKNKVIVTNALEYAFDANVLPDNFAEMDALIESVGDKIDEMQAEYDKNVSCYALNRKKQMETLLRDLQIVHFGLIAISLTNLQK